MNGSASIPPDSARVLAAELRAYIGLLRDAGMIYLVEGEVKAHRISTDAWAGVELEDVAQANGRGQGQTVPEDNAPTHAAEPPPPAVMPKLAETAPVTTPPIAEAEDMEPETAEIPPAEEPPIAILAGVAETTEGTSVPVEMLHAAMEAPNNNEPTAPEEEPSAPEVPGQVDLFAMLGEPAPKPASRGRRKRG